MLPVFGYDDAPHGHAEVVFENVRVPAAKSCWARGAASRSPKAASAPAHSSLHAAIGWPSGRSRRCAAAREPRRRSAAHLGSDGDAGAIAEARIDDRAGAAADLKAAWMMDIAGNKAARAEIAMIKVVAPNMACQVIDWAIQAFGGAGVTDDYGPA